MSFVIEAWCCECKQLGPVDSKTGACSECHQEARDEMIRLAGEKPPLRSKNRNVQQIPRDGTVMIALDGRKTRNIL